MVDGILGAGAKTWHDKKDERKQATDAVKTHG
jgi:hypothetical protein